MSSTESTTAATKSRRPKAKRLAGGITASIVGASLLLGGGGTLASWEKAAPLNASGSGTVRTGGMALELTGEQWSLNGAAVSDSGAVVLSPGDVLEYTANAQSTISGNSMRAALEYADGVQPTVKELEDAGLATSSWTVNGTEAQVFTTGKTPDELTFNAPVRGAITMAPIGDHAYDGGAGMNLEVQLTAPTLSLRQME